MCGQCLLVYEHVCIFITITCTDFIKGSTVQELIKGCQDHDTIQHSLNSFVAVACLVLWLPAVSGNITAPKPCAFKDSQDMWHAANMQMPRLLCVISVR